MSNSAASPTDPLHCREILLQALARPELVELEQPIGAPSPSALDAAWDLSLALGRCRLFGVKLEEDLDGTLPSSIAVAAATRELSSLSKRLEVVKSFDEAWDECVEPLEAESLCLGLLEDTMDLWATFVAVDEAYQSTLLQSKPEQQELSVVIDSLLEKMGQWDQAMREHKELLATASLAQLLDNWRRLLAPAFQEHLPWWLSGELEAVGQEMQRSLLSSLEQLSPSSRATLLMEWSWLPPVTLTRLAASPLTKLASPELRWWRSPTGEEQACLTAVKNEDNLIQLDFFHGEGQASVSSASEISLGGVSPESVSAAETVTFSLEKLHNAARSGQPFTLVVRSVPWIPTTLEERRS